MKSEKLGWLSVVVASACCVLPLAAALVGLGSVGLGSIFGSIGVYFDLAGLLLLAIAWFYFLRERRRVCALNSAVRADRRTISTLLVASVLVVLFAGSGLAPRIVRAFASPAALAQGAGRDASSNAGAYLRKVLAVKGMDCAACIPEIKSSLAAVAGVHSADVNLRSETVTVEYDPAKASPKQLVNAVKAAGYDAKLAN